MKLKSCGLSDVGMKRSNNQDSYLVNDQFGIYAIADGMGGHAGGEFASKIAVSSFEEVVSYFRTGRENQLFSLIHQENDPNEELLRETIQIANERIFQKTLTSTELKGMGTTSTILFFAEKKLYIGHVGDSRAYRFRKNDYLQLTEDHSFVNEQLKSGLISAEEARNHQFKNVITRSVGINDEVEVDIYSFDLETGDKFLICSDGLSNHVREPEMQYLLNNYDLYTVSRELIECANQRGGDDNISVVLIEVVDLN